MKTLTLKITAFLLIMAGIFVSCDKDDDNKPNNETEMDFPVEVPFIEVAKNDYYSDNKGFERMGAVIMSKTPWDSLVNVIHQVQGNQNLGGIQIDFDKQMVIVVFDERHFNGGWSIDLTSITEYTDNSILTYENLKTGNILSVITRPYHHGRNTDFCKRCCFSIQRRRNVERRKDMKIKLLAAI